MCLHAHIHMWKPDTECAFVYVCACACVYICVCVYPWAHTHVKVRHLVSVCSCMYTHVEIRGQSQESALIQGCGLSAHHLVGKHLYPLSHLTDSMLQVKIVVIKKILML